MKLVSSAVQVFEKPLILH